MKRLLFFSLMALAAPQLCCHSRVKQVVIGIAINPAQHPAVLLATKEINAQGGIKGVPLKLMGLEYKPGREFDAQEILKWAKQFAETKDLVAVIGHSDSAATLSAAAFYNQHQVPQIVTIATNPSITNIGSWTYRLCVSDAAQGPALAEYVIKDWQKRRIAVFYVNDDYGRGLAHSFENRVQELGGEIISSVLHRNLLQADDQELIHSVLTRLQRGNPPQLFVLFQRTLAAQWTINAIRQANPQADILGGDSLGEGEFMKKMSGLAKGIRISQFFLPRPEDADAMRFVRNFREFARTEPDYGGAFAYDAVYLIRDALQYAGLSRAGVKSYLDHVIQEKIVRKGVAGSYTLNPDHDARRSLAIVELREGGQQFVKALSVK